MTADADATQASGGKQTAIALLALLLVLGCGAIFGKIITNRMAKPRSQPPGRLTDVDTSLYGESSLIQTEDGIQIIRATDPEDPERFTPAEQPQWECRFYAMSGDGDALPILLQWREPPNGHESLSPLFTCLSNPKWSTLHAGTGDYGLRLPVFGPESPAVRDPDFVRFMVTGQRYQVNLNGYEPATFTVPDMIPTGKVYKQSLILVPLPGTLVRSDAPADPSATDTPAATTDTPAE